MATAEEDKIHDSLINTNWTLSTIKEFVEVLMNITLCNDIQDLKGHIFLEYIWKEMEKKLDTNSNLLKNFWFYRLHLQLFCVEPIYLNDIKIRLIEYFHNKEIKNRKSINWYNITLYFDGFTRQFLYSIFYNLILVAKSKTNSTNFKEHIRYLYTEYIPFLIKNTNDKILPRLLYTEGNIRHKDTDLEEIKFENY